MWEKIFGMLNAGAVDAEDADEAIHVLRTDLMETHFRQPHSSNKTKALKGVARSPVAWTGQLPPDFLRTGHVEFPEFGNEIGMANIRRLQDFCFKLLPDCRAGVYPTHRKLMHTSLHPTHPQKQ